MSGLLRTPLPTPLKSDLAASAMATQGDYGAVTSLSTRFGVSRPTVYSTAAEARRVLDTHYRRMERSGQDVVVTISEATLERAVVALRVVGHNSLRAIEDLLPILYPGVKKSYGTIQGVLAAAEERAARFNEDEDVSAVRAGALDEMFSQGDPVLAGVCLRSGYLFGLSLQEQRGGAQWAAFLEQSKTQGLDLEIVVKDAAKGIAAGVSAVFPEADQRDDSFHAIYAMGKVRRVLEAKAYAAVAREMEAETQLERVRQGGKGKRAKVAGELTWARRQCRDAIELHDAFERAMNDVVEAMSFVDLETAQIRRPDQMEQGITEAATRMIELEHAKSRRVGKYVRNRAPGLASYMKTVGAELSVLAGHYGDDALRVAAAAWRLNDDLANGRRRWAARETQDTLVAAMSILDGLVGDEAEAVLADVDSVMQRRYRASSAIEGFNAALRPFLYIHKGVTQGFLELFRAYHNLKTRRWGRHKGTSARQCLTGELAADWLTLLGYPPSEQRH